MVELCVLVAIDKPLLGEDLKEVSTQGSGKSSESIWTPFDSITTATVRPTRARVLISWNRTTSNVNYAIVGTSVINGTDIVRGSDDPGINEADLFDYVDETDNTMRIEYERNLIEPLGGFSMAMADVVLDNTSLRFTPDYNATIGTALRPNRPLKLFVGFYVSGQERLIPLIEGLTLQPRENKLQRTVQISVFDYLKWLNEKPQETTIYENKRSDQIIEDILSRAGIGSSNYVLDTGLNTIAFAWFEKGQTAGDRIKQICEAEEAIFYQDELGVLRFENRNKYSEAPFNAPVWHIEPDDILNWEEDYSSPIINRVIVTASPRSVKPEAEVWRDGIEEEIPANTTVDIWASFEDPVTTLVTPVANTDYTAFTATQGAGSNVTNDVIITMDQFTTAAKLTIQNTTGATAYINLLKLRGTPATIDYKIREIYQDDDSINDFNEQQKTIDNPFIDSREFAAQMAKNIVTRHKGANSVIRLTIRGIPQLQLRDQVTVEDPDLGTSKNYRVIGIQGVFDAGGFIQTLRLREINGEN